MVQQSFWKRNLPYFELENCGEEEVCGDSPNWLISLNDTKNSIWNFTIRPGFHFRKQSIPEKYDIDFR